MAEDPLQVCPDGSRVTANVSRFFAPLSAAAQYKEENEIC